MNKLSEQEKTNQNQNSENTKNVVDMLLSKKEIKVVDSETMIKNTQTRVWGALKKGHEYETMGNESDEFLRKHVFSRLDMVVLYVDLVGSTTMTLEFPPEKIATIISSYSQEMASVIRQHNGFVLKFAGDAVIGYFVAEPDSLRAADNAVNCAKSMIMVLEKGINPILNQYDYPDLMIKIGMDFGQSIVVRYGSNPEESHVDLMGPPMNIASKIQAIAKPNQILIGGDIYERLHPTVQSSFKQIVWEHDEWRYRSRTTGEIYRVYEYKS